MAGSDWSRSEVEATVASYLAMLDLELRGKPYSKIEFRRRLKPLLNGRSDPAIERKHMNISAVLIDGLSFPYIAGYKPLRNYQQLLADIVVDRLSGEKRLAEAVTRQVLEPVLVSRVEDILSRLVPAPKREKVRTVIREAPVPVRRTDYLAMEAANRGLGSAGEDFVVAFETARLLAAKRDRLAQRVERVSETRGDGLGFDVLSFEESGRERLIEVKTTAWGAETPFYVSRNEVEVSSARAEEYAVYRLYTFRTDPHLFIRSGSIARSFELDAIQYVARVG